MDQRLRILFVTAEVTPFARTGGLGDVAGTLPRELAALGHDVRVVMPLYQTVREQGFPLTPLLSELPVPLAFGNRTARVWQGQLDEPGSATPSRPSVPVYFIEHDPYFQRPALYGDDNGDYPDNAFRFLFFCRAALALPTGLQWFPQVFHCHDWHTGFVPAYLRFLPALDPRLTSAATLFTIHNLAYQGVFPAWVFGLTGLPLSLFQPAELEFFGGVNFMKAGLRYADRITTVSPTYAEEICTPEGGFGLDGVLRERREALIGILNGADYHAWNPATDSHTAVRYDAADTSGKAACKTALLHAYDLPADPETLLISSITRLVDQKGMDVLAAAIDRLLTLDCSFVLLGSGDARYERFFTDLAHTHPQRVGVQLGFDDVLAHQIQAGSDCLLVPSRFEPCGLTQMYAMRYGTLPIVRSTGGLRDTVVPHDAIDGLGTGFVFTEATTDALVAAIREAASIFADKSRWRQLQDNAMTRDFSWGQSAAHYVELYQQAIAAKP